MNLTELRHQVEAEIASYAYDVPKEAMGSLMPREWVEAQLSEFKAALVEPTWCKIMIGDLTAQILGKEKSEYRECVLVADDGKGHQLYYDAKHKDFVLAYSDKTPPFAFLRGDSVGCFMAR